MNGEVFIKMFQFLIGTVIVSFDTRYHYMEEDIKFDVIMFQFLIGTVITEEIEYSGSVLYEVSIPHRYRNQLTIP